VWDVREAQWQEGYEYLVKYSRREGHARVPVSHEEEGFALGRWVFGQRQAYGKGSLAETRADKLDALAGWVWNARDAHWEESFEQLVRFVEREGHARVPRSYRQDGFRLGGWVKGQRDAYRSGRLTAERRNRLEALPGWVWDGRDG
jgi:hypothetical protein